MTSSTSPRILLMLRRGPETSSTSTTFVFLSLHSFPRVLSPRLTSFLLARLDASRSSPPLPAQHRQSHLAWKVDLRRRWSSRPAGHLHQGRQATSSSGQHCSSLESKRSQLAKNQGRPSPSLSAGQEVSAYKSLSGGSVRLLSLTLDLELSSTRLRTLTRNLLFPFPEIYSSESRTESTWSSLPT